MRTSYGNLAGEPIIFASPIEGWAGQGAPVLFSVGYSSTVASTWNGATGVMLRKMGDKFPTLSINAGGTNTFGNDVAVNSITASLAAFRSTWGQTKKVVLVGMSMGFADVMAWAYRNQSQVAGVIGVVGLMDLDEVWTNNRDIGGGVMSQPTIDAAYGGAYSVANDGPTRSPMRFAGSMPFPITHFYSTGDELIPTATSEAFDALPNVESKIIGSTLHGSPSIAATHNHPDFLPTIAAYSALA